MHAAERLDWIVANHVQQRYDAIVEQWRGLRRSGDARPIDEAVLYYSLVGAVSLAYVSGPEARRLGNDIHDPAFVERFAPDRIATQIRQLYLNLISPRV